MARLTGVRLAACVAFMCAACGGSSSSGNGAQGSSGGRAGSAAHASTPHKPSKPSVKDAGSTAPADAGDTSEPASEPADSGSDMAALPNTIPSARGKCNLHTDFPGDDACLAPPDPDKGFQIHIGPNSYDDAKEVAKFIMEPNGEADECFMKKTPNDKDVMYFVWELSGRPGTHHIINTTLSSDLSEGFGTCVNFAGDGTSMGSLGGASRSYMPPVPVAPENAHLGIPLAAHTQVQHDMHYFNVTDKPILREFWMNVYYVNPKQVKEKPNQIAGLGGFGWNYNPIQPGTHDTFKYECPIDKDGRIIQLLGHTHAHGIRETAHIRNAKGDRQKVFEQYNYLEPQIFNYDSLTKNPAFSDSAPGAASGMLAVAAGDTLEWECEVNNDSMTALRYVNEVQTGEMCNIWGASVGPTISCFLQ